VVGLFFLFLLRLNRLTQLSKFPLHTHLYGLHMKERDSKPNPTTCMIKEKLLLPPPLPQVIQPNPFHPACTWEMTALMLSVRYSLKAPHNLRLFQKSQREITTTKGKLPPKVENMVFEYILLLIVENSWLLKLLDNILFLDILDILDIIFLDMV